MEASVMNDKITAAKIDAVLDPNLCFFGSLLCNLKFVEDPTCETAWTDGTHLGFNPKYIDSLPHAQIVGLLAHEVMHCAGGHPYRRDNREPRKWNVAADLAINQVLTDAGLSLPEGSLQATPDQKGKSAEWIYDRLPDMPNSGSGNGSGSGSGNAPGEVRDSPKGSSNEEGAAGEMESQDTTDTMQQSDWDELARQAAQQAKMRGKLPAVLDRFSKTVAQSRVDWKAALRKFVQQNAKSDYSWTRPSSRYVSQDIYLPGLQSEDMPAVAIAVDTSGSMDDKALAQAKAEIESVMDEMKPARVEVFYADAAVARHDTFERNEPLTWQPAGFGGTDFRPVFEAVTELDEQPVCIIYITDLCGSFPEAPEIPTLWITDTDSQAPFGETIKIG